MMVRRRSGCTVERAVLRAAFLCKRMVSVGVRFVPSARERVVQDVDIGVWVLRGRGMVGFLLVVVFLMVEVVGRGSLVRSITFLAILRVWHL